MNDQRLVQVLLIPPRADMAKGKRPIVEGERTATVYTVPAVVERTLDALIAGRVFERHPCVTISVAVLGGVLPSNCGAALAAGKEMAEGMELVRTGQLQMDFYVYPDAREMAAGENLMDMGRLLVLPNELAAMAGAGFRALLHENIFGGRTVSLLVQPKHFPPPVDFDSYPTQGGLQ